MPDSKWEANKFDRSLIDCPRCDTHPVALFNKVEKFHLVKCDKCKLTTKLHDRAGDAAYLWNGMVSTIKKHAEVKRA